LLDAAVADTQQQLKPNAQHNSTDKHYQSIQRGHFQFHHHQHQFILETQNRTMSENTEQNNKTCVPRVRKAATALTTVHITKSSMV